MLLNITDAFKENHLTGQERKKSKLIPEIQFYVNYEGYHYIDTRVSSNYIGEIIMGYDYFLASIRQSLEVECDTNSKDKEV